MTPPHDPTSPAAFERRYRDHADPWGFATEPYEQARYAALLDAIGPGPFATAFEPGCSVGVFTALVAPRCTTLLATDPAPTAIAATRRRCAGLGQVCARVGVLPADLPAARCELIVFSEVGYYFDDATLDRVIAALAERLEPHGRLAGTHWLGRSADHRLTGERVHAALDAHPALRPERGERHDGYLLGVWAKR